MLDPIDSVGRHFRFVRLLLFCLGFESLLLTIVLRVVLRISASVVLLIGGHLIVVVGVVAQVAEKFLLQSDVLRREAGADSPLLSWL